MKIILLLSLCNYLRPDRAKNFVFVSHDSEGHETVELHIVGEIICNSVFRISFIVIVVSKSHCQVIVYN